jgi:hypothetical protein
MKYSGLIGITAVLFVCCVNSQAALTSLTESTPETALAANNSYTPSGPAQLLNYTSSPFTESPNLGLNGTLNSWVVSGDTANPLGGLTFFYQATITGNHAESLTLSGFGGLAQIFVANSDVNASLTSVLGQSAGSPSLVAGGVAPTAAVLDSGTVQFTWDPPVLGGNGVATEILVVDTSATAYQTVYSSLEDDGSSVGQTLAPAPAIPEVTTMVSGLALMLPVGVRAFRRARKSR